MQENAMLDTVERYIKGEMLPEERVFFEQLRKSNPSVDQMVVEHTIFMNQMDNFGEEKISRTPLKRSTTNYLNLEHFGQTVMPKWSGFGENINAWLR